MRPLSQACFGNCAPGCSGLYVWTLAATYYIALVGACASWGPSPRLALKAKSNYSKPGHSFSGSPEAGCFCKRDEVSLSLDGTLELLSPLFAHRSLLLYICEEQVEVQLPSYSLNSSSSLSCSPLSLPSKSSSTSPSASSPSSRLVDPVS